MIPVLHGVWAAAGGLVGDFEHIETQTVGAGGAASVTFNSIPGTYKHLQIRWIARQSGTSPTENTDFRVRFNSDTGSNYARHRLFGTGSATGSSAATSQTSGGTEIGVIPASDMLANTFGVGVVDVLDYASTSKYKTVRFLSGIDDNSGTTKSRIALSSTLWMSTSAITTILCAADLSGTPAFTQHSSFSLYGVK